MSSSIEKKVLNERRSLISQKIEQLAKYEKEAKILNSPVRRRTKSKHDEPWIVKSEFSIASLENVDSIHDT